MTLIIFNPYIKDPNDRKKTIKISNKNNFNVMVKEIKVLKNINIYYNHNEILVILGHNIITGIVSPTLRELLRVYYNNISIYGTLLSSVLKNI